VGFLHDRVVTTFATASRARVDETTSPVTPESPQLQTIVAEATAPSAQQRLPEALADINRALEADPARFELLCAKATVLTSWGRLREALTALSEAASSDQAGAPVFAKLAFANLAAQRNDQALASMKRALDLEPRNAQWHVGMGVVLQSAQRTDEAIACFETALVLDPRNVSAMVEIAKCHMGRLGWPQCETAARRALAVDPTSPEAWEMLAVAELQQGRQAEGFEALRQAEKCGPRKSDLEAFANDAVGLADLGQTREAIALLERNLPTHPNLIGHLAYAPALLTEGRFIDGWTQFEFRWFCEPLASLRPYYGRPVWRGQDLHGKTILLRAEQGFGDIFNMIRYAPLLKARGATVLLVPIPPMAPLYAYFPGVDRVVEENEVLDFDYYIHLMSLPHAFGTTQETIPAEVPYLRANPECARRWAQHIPQDGKLNVGLVWAGNPKQRDDQRRSLHMSRLEPILGVGGVRFFSLQKGPATEQIEPRQPDVDLVNLGPDLADFGDTAAVLSQLDLLISTCTSVPHLAGALGKPVWVMLSEPTDYRWLKGRDDSPWYPTMRLFRQPQPKAWDDVIGRVRDELQRLVAVGASEARRTLAERSALGASGVSRSVANDVSHRPPGMSIAAETRQGLIQFVPEDSPEGRSIDYYGEYLQPQLEQLLRLLRPAQTLLEVGSGYGMHAIALGAFLKDNGHLIVHEPNAAKQRMLVHNLAANGVANVTLLRGALRGATRSADGARQNADQSGPAKQSMTGDSIDELGLERLDWLKINSTADATQVLSGASGTLWKLRPCMLIAGIAAGSAEPLADFCKGHGYRAWRLDTKYFNPANFNCRVDDIFDGALAAAMLAVPEEVDVTLVKSLDEL